MHLRPKFYIFLMLTVIMLSIVLILVSIFSGNQSYPGSTEPQEPEIQLILNCLGLM